jgi:hypothetical protein
MLRSAACAFVLVFASGSAVSAARAAAIRLWTEVASAPMGHSPSAVRAKLRGAKLKKGRGKKGRSAYSEKVIFERHTPARVTYRFIAERLYEVELRYLKKGRVARMASLLKKKYSGCKAKGKKVRCASGGMRIALQPSRGHVVVVFSSPKVLAAAAETARKKKKPKAKAEEASDDGDEDEEASPKAAKKKAKAKGKAKAKKKAAASPEPTKRTSPRTIYTDRAQAPALWDALGVKQGPLAVFRVKLRGEKKGSHLVAAGFRRAAGEPLAAILSQDLRIVHLGPACEGTPFDVRAVDFRLDGNLDAVVTYGEAARRLAIVPYDQKFAGAKFIGGRFGGRNAFRCYRTGTDIERVDFADIDYDKSIDLLLTYRHLGAGVVHDVYFFQGNDFYFRETRPGSPGRRSRASR